MTDMKSRFKWSVFLSACLYKQKNIWFLSKGKSLFVS